MKKNPSFTLLCRCLQSMECGGTDAVSSVYDIQPDWYALARIADSHLVTPLLYHRLARKNLLSLLPEDVQMLLTEIYKLNCQRNDIIYSEINRIAALMNPAGIEPVFIKGSAALLMGLYEERGLRVMNDVDFLVSKKNLPTCVELMRSVGFRDMEGVNLPTDYYHRNPLIHDRHNIRFEIHERLDNNAPLESGMMIADSAAIQMPDGVVRVPSAKHFAIHNILHHQVFDMGFAKGRTPLYQLYDFYMVREKRSREINWPSIFDFFTAHSLQWAYFSSLNMLRKYFKQSPPKKIRLLPAKLFIIRGVRFGKHIIARHIS